MGIVYFIQPEEYIGTDCYKIGRSSRNDLSRMKEYKKGTRFISIKECSDDVILEKKIINYFAANFTKEKGNEYFRGNKDVMLKAFDNLYNEYECKNNIINNENNKFKCEYCKKDYKTYQSRWNHINNFHKNIVDIKPSVIKENNANKINLEKEIVKETVKNNKKNVLECTFCKNEYSSRQNRWKHEQKCKIKNDNAEKERIQKIQMEKDNEIQMLKKKINEFELIKQLFLEQLKKDDDKNTIEV